MDRHFQIFYLIYVSSSFLESLWNFCLSHSQTRASAERATLLNWYQSLRYIDWGSLGVLWWSWVLKVHYFTWNWLIQYKSKIKQIRFCQMWSAKWFINFLALISSSILSWLISEIPNYFQRKSILRNEF